MKGVLSTVEAVIAITMIVIILTLLFTSFSKPKEFTKENSKIITFNTLKILADTGKLRTDALNNNVSSIENELSAYIPTFLNYNVTIYPSSLETLELYVDGWNNIQDEWTKYGSSPWLNATGDGNRITDSIGAKTQKEFTFVDTSKTGTINSINVSVYGEETLLIPGDYAQLYVYIHNTTDWYEVGMLTYYYENGSIWQNIDISNYLDIWNEINSAKLYLKSGTIYAPFDVDAAKLVVNYFTSISPSIQADDVVTVSYFLAGDIGNYSAREVKVFLWGFD